MKMLGFYILVFGAADEAVMQSIVDVLVPILVSTLLGLLGAVMLKVNAFLRTKLGLSSIDFATSKLDSVIPAIVAEADATIVAGLRDANRDGRITSDEAREVMLTVIERVKAQLGAAGFEDVRKHFGVDADTLLAIIRSRIEATVDARKRELTPPIVATASTPEGASAAVSVPSPGAAPEPSIPRSLSPDGPAKPR